MAEAGQELDNPITGQRLVFRQTSAQTSGELLEVESSWRGGDSQPPLHFHPAQDERFEVLDGSLRSNVDGKVRDLGPGDVLEIPRNTPHAMFAPGPEGARAIWQTRPALGTEHFFEALWGLAAAGKVDKQGRPGPLQAAVLAERFSGEVRMASPPALVQSVVLPPLALVGRLLGRSAEAPPA